MQVIIFLAIVSFIFTQNNTTKLSFLEGTWKVDGKEKYEEWKLKNDGTLTAKIFKIQNTDLKITETSEIVSRNSKYIMMPLYQVKIVVEQFPFN